MTASGDGAALRIAFAADDPDHAEAAAIAGWLARAEGVEARQVTLAGAAAAPDVDDVVWIHGVRPVPLEDLGAGGAAALLRGRMLLTGGAAVLPAAAGLDAAAPNETGRSRWPATPDDDARPPLRGHASFRGHPLFDGLGAAPLTWAPAAGEEHTRVGYVRPAWPARARVLAVERSRLRIAADRATIWEYHGATGRTLCIGAFLPLHGADPALRAAAERLAANALRRVAEPAAVPGGDAGAADGSAGGEWRPIEAGAAEDRRLRMPELPLLEEPVGSLEFRLRRTLAAADDAPFYVAGRRAFAAGGVARGLDEVWAHPVRLASGLRLHGGAGEAAAITPLGVERRLRVGEGVVVERVVVPREAPACVLEWSTRGRPLEIEIGWTCDLRLAAPYPPGCLGPLRWRRAARGLVVAGAGDDRAVFAFNLPADALETRDVSAGGLPVLRVRARFRLQAQMPLRLAIAGAAGDAAVRRALSAAERGEALLRSREAHAERLMAERLSLDAPDPSAVQRLEWAKHELDAALAESPGAGRSLLAGYGSSPDAARAPLAPVGAVFGGGAGARGALAALAAGDFTAARDVLSFLGRHQDPAGRAPAECSTSGVAAHDDPWATPLYLLLAARYLAWTGDIPLLRREWRRILRAYDAVLRPGWAALAGDATAPTLAAALAELAVAAESIGESGAAVELRAAAARGAAGGGGAPWSVERGEREGSSAILALVHGTLGAEPDATRGRLVLRPRPPVAWSRFRVAGLRIGDASVAVDYRRRGAAHTFRVAQDRGGAPVRVILEPALPGGALRAAAVDGVPAELDARGRGGEVVVPVQVVLDHPREVVLEMAGVTETVRRRE